MLRLTVPEFTVFYAIDAFRPDGSVIHMAANAIDPTRAALTGYTLMLSDAGRSDVGGDRRWTAGAPFGAALIAVVAASAPLFASERPAHEAAEPYLAALRAAIEHGQANGVHLAVDAVPLEVVRRPAAEVYVPAVSPSPPAQKRPRVVRAPPLPGVPPAPEALRPEPMVAALPATPPLVLPPVVQPPPRQSSVAQRFLGQPAAVPVPAPSSSLDSARQANAPPAPIVKVTPDAAAGGSEWTVRTFNRQPGGSTLKTE